MSPCLFGNLAAWRSGLRSRPRFPGESVSVAQGTWGRTGETVALRVAQSSHGIPGPSGGLGGVSSRPGSTGVQGAAGVYSGTPCISPELQAQGLGLRSLQWLMGMFYFRISGNNECHPAQPLFIFLPVEFAKKTPWQGHDLQMFFTHRAPPPCCPETGLNCAFNTG